MSWCPTPTARRRRRAGLRRTSRLSDRTRTDRRSSCSWSRSVAATPASARHCAPASSTPTARVRIGGDHQRRQSRRDVSLPRFVHLGDQVLLSPGDHPLVGLVDLDHVLVSLPGGKATRSFPRRCGSGARPPARAPRHGGRAPARRTSRTPPQPRAGGGRRPAAAFAPGVLTAVAISSSTNVPAIEDSSPIPSSSLRGVHVATSSTELLTAPPRRRRWAWSA